MMQKQDYSYGKNGKGKSYIYEKYREVNERIECILESNTLE